MARVGWKELHEELCTLARRKGVYDAEEARLLLLAESERVWEPAGFGSLFEYLERLFGYAPRLAREKLRVAGALAMLPKLEAELEEARLSWSAVREISRVAVPETEEEWIEAASGRTVREVEEMVSGLRSGDLPGSVADPELVRHVLRFEVSGDTLAALREARKALELEVGHALDDDQVLAMMARSALGEPGQEGRAPYQVLLTLCGECGYATRDGAGAEVEVSSEVRDAALCDAQVIDMKESAHPERRRSRRTHVGRARQEIPPAMRRYIERRDHGRCQVPGCRASKYLDCHHIVFRSAGGRHEKENLVLVCGAHHRAVHAGTLVIEGRAPAVTVRSADGGLYGSELLERAGAP